MFVKAVLFTSAPLWFQPRTRAYGAVEARRSAVAVVSIFDRQPLALAAIGTSPVLLGDFRIVTMGEDDVIGTQHPAFNLLTEAGEGEALELEGDLAIDASVRAV